MEKIIRYFGIALFSRGVGLLTSSTIGGLGGFIVGILIVLGVVLMFEEAKN